jgi:hypothetical protein
LWFSESRSHGIQARQQPSGRDHVSYINDNIALFPKAKLAALFDEKLNEDADFKAAIEGVRSDEFQQLYAELWQSEEFLKEIQILEDNGLSMSALIDEVIAIMGQN